MGTITIGELFCHNVSKQPLGILGNNWVNRNLFSVWLNRSNKHSLATYNMKSLHKKSSKKKSSWCRADLSTHTISSCGSWHTISSPISRSHDQLHKSHDQWSLVAIYHAFVCFVTYLGLETSEKTQLTAAVHADQRTDTKSTSFIFWPHPLYSTRRCGTNRKLYECHCINDIHI